MGNKWYKLWFKKIENRIKRYPNLIFILTGCLFWFLGFLFYMRDISYEKGSFFTWKISLFGVLGLMGPFEIFAFILTMFFWGVGKLLNMRKWAYILMCILWCAMIIYSSVDSPSAEYVFDECTGSEISTVATLERLHVSDSMDGSRIHGSFSGDIGDLTLLLDTTYEKIGNAKWKKIEKTPFGDFFIELKNDRFYFHSVHFD